MWKEDLVELKENEKLLLVCCHGGILDVLNVMDLLLLNSVGVELAL